MSSQLISVSSVFIAALVGLPEIPVAPVRAYLLFAENPGLNTAIGGAVILCATTYYLVAQHLRQRPGA